jgi:hypothetical protein
LYRLWETYMYFFIALQEMGHFLPELKGNNPIKNVK